jgi:hypothetical protein
VIGHDDAVIEPGLIELAASLVDQLEAIGEKESPAAEGDGRADDVGGDVCLPAAGW